MTEKYLDKYNDIRISIAKKLYKDARIEMRWCSYSPGSGEILEFQTSDEKMAKEYGSEPEYIPVNFEHREEYFLYPCYLYNAEWVWWSEIPDWPNKLEKAFKLLDYLDSELWEFELYRLHRDGKGEIYYLGSVYPTSGLGDKEYYTQEESSPSLAITLVMNKWIQDNL